MEEKYYWYSFAGIQGNLGVVLTQADTREEADEKAKPFTPEGTIDVRSWELKEKELPECDKLYSPKEMKALGYEVNG